MTSRLSRGFVRLKHWAWLIALVVTITVGGETATAVPPQLTWSKPSRISRSDNFAFTPFIVADPAGNLHAVWSQNDRNQKKEDQDLDTIYYSTKRGTTWSAPVDIVAASTGEQARVNRLRIDSAARLHIVWVNSNGSIFHASAPAANAASVNAWQVDRIPEPAWLADLAVGTDGTLHLVYANVYQGISYRQSKDGGVSWSAPVGVSPLLSGGYFFTNVRIEVDTRDILHVVWATGSDSGGAHPYGVAYARSTDGGKTWDNTLNVSEGDNLPSIGFDNQGGLHLVWDNPAGSMLGRGHAWSTDGGKTWKKRERIFPGYRGQTWWPVMAQDSAGTLHLIFAANSPKGSDPQTWHSVWDVDHWRDPELISGDLLAGEGPSIAVSEGNKLNVIWFTYNSAEYGIWYTTAQTSAPAIAPQPLPTSVPTPTSLPTQAKPSLVPTVAVKATLTNSVRSDAAPISSDSSWMPLVTGLVPAFLLIFVLFLVRLVRGQSR